jgi:hypothetical protein
MPFNDIRIYENFIYRKSPMADFKLALYVNLFLDCMQPINRAAAGRNI